MSSWLGYSALTRKTRVQVSAMEFFILLNEINTVYVYPFSNGRSFLKLQQMLNVYTKKVTRETKLSEEKVYIKTKREEHIVTNFNLDCFY